MQAAGGGKLSWRTDSRCPHQVLFKKALPGWQQGWQQFQFSPLNTLATISLLQQFLLLLSTIMTKQHKNVLLEPAAPSKVWHHNSALTMPQLINNMVNPYNGLSVGMKLAIRWHPTTTWYPSQFFPHWEWPPDGTLIKFAQTGHQMEPWSNMIQLIQFDQVWSSLPVWTGLIQFDQVYIHVIWN